MKKKKVTNYEAIDSKQRDVVFLTDWKCFECQKQNKRNTATKCKHCECPKNNKLLTHLAVAGYLKNYYTILLNQTDKTIPTNISNLCEQFTDFDKV